MSQRPSTIQSFFAEMKRRRVFKVMAVYGAVAFAALQLADLLIEPLGVPEWTMQFLLLIALVGFPIAIVLAWAFETTPEGVRRTAVADDEEIRQILAAPRSHRWPAGLLALAGMTLLFATGWWMGAGRDAGGPAGALVPEIGAAEVKAIAALPFENVNGDEDNRIMAIGIHDDLLAQLSRISSLRVTSRTSVNDYATTDLPLSEVARELGVAYILEGSVRRSGSSVRVSVTLVEPASGEQMWTEQYTREVTPDNLFDIQSDIARRVVAGLEARLTPEDEERLEAMEPASDLAAQSWYYRGLDLYSRESLDGLSDARDALLRAVAIDSTYLAAWSWLAMVESRMVFVGAASTPAGAEAALERTATLAPESLEAHLARGYVEYYARRNFDAARSAFRAAVRLGPSDARASWALALILRRQGEWEESTRLMKAAVQLDPRNPLRLETLHENLSWSGAFRDANTVVERAIAIDPSNARARSRKVQGVIELDGATDAARRLAGELGLDPRSFEESGGLADLALLDRDYDRLLAIADAVEADIGLLVEDRLSSKATALAYLGDPSLQAVVDTFLAIETPSLAAEVGHPARDGYVKALAGRTDEARADLREAEDRVRTWEDHVLGDRWAFLTVAGYGAIGELDAGFGLIEESIDRPSTFFSSTRLRLDPRFDPYRDDPRFDALIDRRGVFEAEGARMGEAGRPWLP